MSPAMYLLLFGLLWWRPSECLVPGEWTGIEGRKEVFMKLNHLLMEWHGYLKGEVTQN